MIKKFREYITEKTKMPSYEDVEDQFLRLEEVYDCVVDMHNYKADQSINVYVYVYAPHKIDNEIVDKEISEIKI